MIIAVDAMGGDFSPQAPVQGSIDALKRSNKELDIILLGDENRINNILNDEKTLLMKSKLSCENYLSNPGNSSEKLLSFLSNINTN